MCFELVLIVCGSSLLAIGFGLGLLFGGFDVPAAGPAGIAVAILLGSGVCVLLLAALRRAFPASRPLRTNVVDLSDDERLGRLAESRVRRAKLTVFFSAASTFMAFTLFLGGIPVAFIDFNFASGTNDIGLIMMFTGLVVGVIVIVGSLIGIPFGWIAWNASGNFTWFFAALSLPIIQVIACLVVTYTTR